MGSKSRVAKYIVPIIQKYIDDSNIKTYIEPCVGGANIIDKIKCETKIGTDKNRYLIALLRYVQAGGQLLNEVSKELYDKVRNAVNDNDTHLFEDWYVGNVGFLASFNGRWFDGGYAKTGYENTKSGQRLRNYYQEAKNNILKQAPDLKNIAFSVADYREYSSFENCIVYVDPPYQNTKKYSNAIDFDYDEFWETMRKWSTQSINSIILISEQNAPDDFECLWEQEVSRSIKATDKSKSVERLFKYAGN